MQNITHLPIIGENLKRARKKKFPNDTQYDAALRTGVSRATYQKMEKGDLTVSLSAYLNAADIYSTTDCFEQMFTQSPEPVSLFEEFGASYEE